MRGGRERGIEYRRYVDDEYPRGKKKERRERIGTKWKIVDDRFRRRTMSPPVENHLRTNVPPPSRCLQRVG